MKPIIGRALALAMLAAAAPAVAEITFYEHESFEGRSLTAQRPMGDLERSALRNRAASAVVAGDRWEVCDDRRFEGSCRVLRPGRYPSLSAMGLRDPVSSVRAVPAGAQVDEDQYAPAPWQVGDYRRRRNERVHEAQVTSVRAVLGPPEQRCWVEHGQVREDHQQGNIVGGITGAVLGGILGHQVGSGRGNDVATVGGALAGGAIGMNVARDRDGRPAYNRDVQRCRDVPSQAEPAYWDVTYTFRGVEHEMQTATRPGATVRVNERGEPRA